MSTESDALLSPFDKLPDELLLNMLSPIACNNVCLVNHRFARIATPLLYAEYEIGSYNCHLPILVTLYNRPELGKLIRSVTSVSGHYEMPSHLLSAKLSAPTLALCDKFKEGIDSQVALPDPESFDEEAGWSDDLGLFTLLCQTPNVEAIFVKTFWERGCVHDDGSFGPGSLSLWIHPIIAAAKSAGLGNVHRFEKLRSIHLKMTPETSLKDLWHLFRLPSLRNVVFEHFQHIAGDIPEWCRSALPVSSVESLDFPSARYSPDTLGPPGFSPVMPAEETIATMIRMCKALRHFGHHHHYEYTKERARTWSAAVGRALRLHRKSLRSLDVKAFLYNNDNWSGRLGPLSDWPFLETIKLPWPGYFREGSLHADDLEQLLPSNGIQSLEIFWCNNDSYPEVYKFLSALADGGRFPVLKEVSLQTEISIDYDWTPLQVLECSQLLRARGIKVRHGSRLSYCSIHAIENLRELSTHDRKIQMMSYKARGTLDMVIEYANRYCYPQIVETFDFIGLLNE